MIKKRKILLDTIRKQGNYYLNVQSNIIRPVRAQKNVSSALNDDTYIACTDCFGFYKKRFLRRHRKKCPLKSQEANQRENHLSEAQKFMVCSGNYKDLYNSLRLK